MTFSGLNNILEIDRAIDYSPRIVNVKTYLNEAIDLMSQAKGSYCDFACTEKNLDVLPKQNEPSSCLVVTKNNVLVGILTERDLLKLAVKNVSLKGVTVDKVMTTPVISFPYTEFTNIFMVYSLMRRHSIRHLPIVDSQNNPLGLVTLSSLRQTLDLGHFLRFRQVQELMSYQVIWADPSTPLIQLAKMMLINKISCVVLVEAKGEILIPVGIITERDIAQYQGMELNLQIPAEKVMSYPLFCLKPEDSLAYAHQKMQELKIRRFVVIGEQGELRGIITESNLSQVMDQTEIYGILEILQRRVTQLEQDKAYLLRRQGIELNQAIEKEEFELYYQPQLNLKTNQIIGAEALVRWHSPQKGLVEPAEFIALVETTGLIVPFGQWLFKTICQQILEWRKNDLPVVPISINISSKQFSDDNLSDKILFFLTQYQVEPSLLKLELTESLLVENIEVTIQQFKALKSVGISIAIDDFGTGYASLGYLQRFPFDILKIDRCFVENIHQNTKNAAITNAIIRMAKQLNFEVIAEGVETLAERDCLYSYGCELIQGYLISQPLPASKFIDFLKIT